MPAGVNIVEAEMSAEDTHAWSDLDCDYGDYGDQWGDYGDYPDSFYGDDDT